MLSIRKKLVVKNGRRYAGRGVVELIIWIVAMLVFVVTLSTSFSCYRICMEDRKRKKLKLLLPNEVEPNLMHISTETPHTQRSDIVTTQQSDIQLIFGTGLSNNSTRTTDVLTTPITQEMIRQRPLADTQNEYERRAQERRDNLERNLASARDDNDEFLSVPPYNYQDDTLPSYDQVVHIEATDDCNK